MTNRSVLLVEDEIDMRGQFAQVLEGEGYEVVTAESGEIAWDMFKRANYLVVVTDLILPQMGGLKVLEKIKSLHPATKVIIVTARGDKHAAIKAVNLDAFRYIEKGPSTAIRDLLSAVEMAFAVAETHLQVEKDVLSFLTHTLRNTLSGGPQTVDQILRLLQALFPDEHEDQRINRIRNNVASLQSIFATIGNMLDAYKFYITDPVDMRRKWREDKGGSVSMESLIALVLKQTIGRILFEENNITTLKRLLGNPDLRSIKIMRDSFLGDVLLRENPANNHTVLEWVENYFRAITFTIAKLKIRFNPNGIRFSLLFAILSEIIYNSFKYSTGVNPIQVSWTKHETGYMFACRNEFSERSTERTGSQKGLVFISSLTRIIEGVEFAYRTEDNTFIVELQFEHGSL